MDRPGVFDPEELIRVLHRHHVRYVLVGGVAARLHGAPTLTEDLDLSPERSRENLARLAAALHDLQARLAVPDPPEGLRVPLDADTFSSPVMKFTTRAGEVDIVLEAIGVGGYEQLRPRSVAFAVVGVEIQVAQLRDIIASKEASGRAKDRAHLELLRQLQRELAERDGPSAGTRDP